MLYMVIETFLFGPDAVYRRFHEKGRMLPSGLEYISSWISADKVRCFQIMSTNEPSLFDDWISNWDDIVSFEIIPVLSSEEAQRRIKATQQVSTRPGT